MKHDLKHDIAFYREAIDALNAASRGMQAQASGHHAVNDQLHRVDAHIQQVEGLIKELLTRGEASTELRLKVEDLTTEVGELRAAIDILNDRDERTDQIQKQKLQTEKEKLQTEKEKAERADALRQELLRTTGGVLQSKPALMIYSLLGILLLQRLGFSNANIRDFVARYMLGVPVAESVEEMEQAPEGTLMITPTPDDGGADGGGKEGGEHVDREPSKPADAPPVRERPSDAP